MDTAALSRLLPPATEENLPYWEGCTAGELRLQRCSDCAEYRFPDAPLCPSCLSSCSRWTAVSGLGRIWSWVVMHKNYFPAFADEVPYIVAFVRLDEGPLMISSLADPSVMPECDMRVRVVFQRATPDRTIPTFEVHP